MTARYTYSLDPEIEERLEKMASTTHRSKSGMLSYLILQEWERVASFMAKADKNPPTE